MLQTAYSAGLIAIFASAGVVFVALFFVSAPYGRYQRSGWGPSVATRTAWVVMELPAVAVIAVCALNSVHEPGSGARMVPYLLLLFWQVHYVYRTFLFPMMMRGGDKRFPVVLVLFAMIYNTANGFVNGYNLFLSGRVYDLSWLTSLRFMAGAALFLMGLYAHVTSDRTLRRLRRETEIGYTIPRGGLFELVSAPNYFGEIVQWLGWALMTWSFAGLSFAFFTIANLLPRGIRHHRWYHEQFEDYPEKRRAVVPFLM